MINPYTNHGRECMQPYNQIIQGGAMPLFPTGVPTGPSMSGPSLSSPTTSMNNSLVYGHPAPQTTENVMYTSGFLKTQIGRKMRVEFLIGSGPLVDRTGTLRHVGASYILLQPIDSQTLTMCDLYSIKFVNIIS